MWILELQVDIWMSDILLAEILAVLFQEPNSDIVVLLLKTKNGC